MRFGYTFALLAMLTGLFPIQAGKTALVRASAEPIVADHTIMRRIYDAEVPVRAIEDAKRLLRIGYGHTSHGSQVSEGMNGLVGFVDQNNDDPSERFAASSDNVYYDSLFAWSRQGRGDELQLYEGSGYGSGYLPLDCGNDGWDDHTRRFLTDNPGFNVIIWSWCGQVSWRNVRTQYIDLMENLERDYPDVVFVYMTGHVAEGFPDVPSRNPVLANNDVIRRYCRENGKVLYDFADIEKYNLDGEYFGNRELWDSCDYSGGNWAREWQSSHIEGVDWYSCRSEHSEPVNANQKAYAAWWLWARIAGWDG